MDTLLNSENEIKILCYNCRKELNLQAGTPLLRSEECPYCYASLRCCRMCNFYDAKAYNNCHETEAERIVDKEKANYCEYFILYGSKEKKLTPAEELLQKANALFKK